MSYPARRNENTFDELAGLRFPDPYRWLEDADNPEVQLWQSQHEELARDHVAEWEHYGRMRALLASLPAAAGTPPVFRGGRWFRIENAESGTHARAVVADEAYGQGETLFDTAVEDPNDPLFISWIAPSPDGAVLALGVCRAGCETNTIRLVDVAGASLLADPPSQVLMDNWTGGVSWLADGGGFFFTALESGGPVDLNLEVFLHRRSADEVTTVKAMVPWRTRYKDYRMVIVSDDGEWAVAHEGLAEVRPVAVARLGDGSHVWREFVTDVDGEVAGFVLDGHLVAVTDVDAPKGRIVSIPLSAADPNNSDEWQEIAPEGEAVMVNIYPTDGAYYLTEFVEGYSRVKVLDRSGVTVDVLPLPENAVVGGGRRWGSLVSRPHPFAFVFGFSTPVTPFSVAMHSPETNSFEVLRAAGEPLTGFRVQRGQVASKDGTDLIYDVVTNGAQVSQGPRPTLICGYGGFKSLFLPAYSRTAAAFVACGGAYVHAHLRGGGEYGRNGYIAGTKQNKKNVYDDLFAIAEDLVRRGIASLGSLGFIGTSNGGLTAGVALTKRPDLWGAVVCRVPRLDTVGALRDGYGQFSSSDRLRDYSDPQEVRQMASLSPYQLAQRSADYPAVLVVAGELDPRCSPRDARKFAAQLQAANTGASPILLHVWKDCSHNNSLLRDIALDQDCEWLAFVARHLGIQSVPETASGSGERQVKDEVGQIPLHSIGS